MKPQRIFLDLDGVLCDFWGGALKWHFLDDPYTDPANLGKWMIPPNLPPAEFWGSLGYGFWMELEETAECREIVALAAGAVGIENVCLLSSPCLTVGCLEGKRTWVERHLPELSRRLLLGACKEFCAGPGKLLVDDSDANVDGWRKGGGSALLVPRPWNSRHGADVLRAVQEGLGLAG